jgi:shikimate kinase
VNKKGALNLVGMEKNATAIAPFRWQNHSLVLIGLMGAGKTTVGRRLAKHIGWRFVDSDDEIAQAAGCSIVDIFSMHGETIFRDLERRVLQRLMQETPCVITTGGGAWMQEPLRRMMQQSATSIWLRAELDVLLARVAHRSHRPLLEQGDKRVILEKLMHDRYPVYAQADLTVDSGDGLHENVVQSIVAQLHAMKKKFSHDQYYE